MGDQAKRAQLAHAIQTLEKRQAGGEAACSACHTIASPEEDQRAFEAAGLKLQRRVAEVRPLIADAGGRAELDAIENDVRQWTGLYREYLGRAGGNDFAAAHDVITQKMLPILGDIDRSTTVLAGQQRAFLEDANTRARITTSRNLWLALFLVAVGLVVIAGAVTVTNLHAPATVSSGNGGVCFPGGRGRQEIENSFGDVEVRTNDGDLVVRNGNSAVTASDISGAVEITNRFGKVRVTNAGRGVTIHRNNGEIEAANVGGPVSISNSSGSVTVTDAGAMLSFRIRMAKCARPALRGRPNCTRPSAG